MTTDKTREAFEQWFNPLKMSTMVHETAAALTKAASIAALAKDEK